MIVHIEKGVHLSSQRVSGVKPISNSTVSLMSHSNREIEGFGSCDWMRQKGQLEYVMPFISFDSTLSINTSRLG